MTATQLESAKRLSQGLSVAQSGRQRNTVVQNGPVLLQNAEAQYSVVLDPQEYNSVNAMNAMNGMNMSNMNMMNQNGYVPVQNGANAYANGNYMIWPSTKAYRLYEESRNNRAKIEAARAHNAAVLRQQIFFFDPTQEMLIGGGSGSEKNSLSANSLVLPSGQFLPSGNQSVSGDGGSVVQGQQQGPRLAMNSNMPMMANSGLHESSFVYGGPPAAMNMNQAQQFQQQQQQQQQQQLRGGRLPSSYVNNPTVYTNLNGVPVAVGNNPGNVAPQAQGTFLTPAQMRVPANNNTPPGAGGSSKQEELLRQLFPSWF
jgi:hypothetical protein